MYFPVLDNIPEHSVMDLMDWGKLHFAYMFSPKLEPTSQSMAYKLNVHFLNLFIIILFF